MGQPGIGAMIHYLGGGSENPPEKYYGRRVVGAALDSEADRVRLSFGDGSAVDIWDNGQSCCESRYITCDDDLSDLLGGDLLRIDVKEHRDEEGEYGEEHEMAFVEIATTAGAITFCTHNEHNGYYGGFGLTLTEPAT